MSDQKIIPEGFIPMVTIGEVDGFLMVYTAESHEDTIDILETTLSVMLDAADGNQGMTMQ